MDTKFWHQRWETNDIGFHGSEANPLLLKYFDRLSLGRGSRVFLPLCGKTRDIAWLLSRGFRVAGAELVAAAVRQLFDELGLAPGISGAGTVQHYRAKDIDIFCGDIFQVTGALLGPVDAVYDRAALVALPPGMRGRYAAHLQKLTDPAPQLLICYEYDQSQMEGPPFSILREEVLQHYGEGYQVTLLESTSVAGGLKGKCAAKENVWKLQKKLK